MWSVRDVLPSRLRGSLGDRLEILLPLLAYLVVVLSRASTSSLGIDFLRRDPSSPLGTTWGTPNMVRSDEWLTQTPIELNVLALGHSSHSPLAESADVIFQISSGQPVESVFFFETTLLRLGPWLPDAMLFAAWRALPLLVLALTLPPLLRRFGATRPMSWLAYALVVLAPTSLWWSFTPIRILMIASLGSFLLAAARDRWGDEPRRRDLVASLALAAAGGMVLARLGTYYVPWCLTVGLPLVLAVAAWLVWSRPRRPGLVLLATGALTGAVFLGLVFWENSAALKAALDTVYPGQRRSTGEAMAPLHLLGTPGLVSLRDGVAPLIANASEIASAFSVCALWAAMLARRLRPAADPGQRAALWALAGSTAVWLAWATVTWGSFGEHLPLFNLVPGPRAAQTVGYPAALALCLVLSRISPVGVRGALPVAGACGLATAYGVSSLQSALPAIGTLMVIVCSVVVAALVLVATVWRSWLPVALITVVLLVSGSFVNPVTFGLGDLRASPAAGAARQIADRARADGTYVAADSPFVSALLFGNGVPTLTGYQSSGPDADQWRLLDPDDRFEEEWNRGASFLHMSFNHPVGTEPTVANPNPDIVQVSTDPCEVDPRLGLGRVISGGELPFPCLELESTFVWSGTKQYVYTVGPADG